MRHNLYASLSFKKKDPVTKVVIGNTIINALQNAGQSMFPNLPVSLEELKKKNKELLSDIAEARAHREITSYKVALSVIQWDASFALTANYVSDIACDNEKVIKLAGFIPVN